MKVNPKLRTNKDSVWFNSDASYIANMHCTVTHYRKRNTAGSGTHAGSGILD
jgi:hypothetical protein